MKTIIKSLIILAVVFTANQSFAQKKTIEASFEVDGVCFMCKDRIENALDTVGVKFANWDVDTHILNVAFREDKYTEKDIAQIVANVGHDSEHTKATDDAYNQVHMCCRYRSQEVLDSHKGKTNKGGHKKNH